MTTTTYSPRQLLEAARRAEANGQRDHASQFCSYLVQLHPTAPEAYEAHEALARLSASTTMGVSFAADPREPRRLARPGAQRANGGAARRAPARRLRTYRLGRLLARVVSLLGTAALVAGLTGFGASLAMGLGKANSVMSAMALAPLAAGGITATGCALLLLAQMAGAVFDAASRGTSDDDA